jgi:hypothetical protein
MKAAIAIIICVVILLLATAVHRTIADHKSRDADVLRDADSTATDLDPNQKTNRGSEWSADPFRGWIRLNDRARKESEASQRNPKTDDNRTLWEY